MSSEKRQWLKKYLSKPISLVLSHGFASTGFLLSIGKDTIVMQCVNHDSDEEYTDIIEIKHIINIRIAIKHIDHLNKLALDKVKKQIDSILPKT